MPSSNESNSSSSHPRDKCEGVYCCQAIRRELSNEQDLASRKKAPALPFIDIKSRKQMIFGYCDQLL